MTVASAYIRLFFTRCENRGRFLKWSHLSLRRRPDNDPTTTRRHLGTKFIYISTVIRYWYRIMPRGEKFFPGQLETLQHANRGAAVMRPRTGEVTGRNKKKKISKETKTRSFLGNKIGCVDKWLEHLWRDKVYPRGSI